jgi:hypothetical protein
MGPEDRNAYLCFNPNVGGCVAGIAYGLSQNEIDTLLGLTTGSAQLWPPLEFWHGYDKWMGQWNSGDEGWFIKRATDIRTASDLKNLARTKTKWRGHLRPCGQKEMENRSTPGRIAEAEHIVTTMDSSFPLAIQDFDLYCV